MRHFSFYLLCVTFVSLSFSLSGMDLAVQSSEEIEPTSQSERAGELAEPMEELIEILKRVEGDLSQLTPEEQALMQANRGRLQEILGDKE